MKSKISKLLVGTITETELVELQSWLNDPKNQSVLESYVQDYHDLNLATLKNDVDVAYKKVLSHIERDERPVRRLFPNWTKYAAAAVLFFGIGFLYQQGFFWTQSASTIVPKEEPTTLEMENGSIKTIDVSKTKEVKDAEGNIIGNQKQNQITYSEITQATDLVYNTLKTPNGQQFQLELSDGTLVYLNAGSSLKYPVNFLSEGPRQVYLMGEAYFDVSRKKSNPFIVNMDELDVKVLGTEFNISAYHEDTNIDVVLIEGAVVLNSNEESADNITKLMPGEKGSFEYSSKNISVGQVNTELHISWMQGHLVYRNLTFDNILTKLERHYNVEIENTNTELGNEVFNASFNNVKIEEVLSFFNDTHEIDYTIKNNRVIIQ